MKKTKVILFVDDDRYEMLALIERLQASGYTVDTVTNPVRALTKLRQGFLPDLIISDLIMPADFQASPQSNRHVGVDFCRKVRELGLKIPVLLKIPILVLTVVTDPVVQTEARQYATGLLVKPVTPGYLLKRVNQALQGEQAEESQE
jgi:two-component system chemotaxis response regulator CheY